MAYDLLTSSGISSLVSDYSTNETTKKITPLKDKVTTYTNLNSAWTTLSSKITTLKSATSDLYTASTSSTIFNSKTSTTSDSSHVDATVSQSASMGAYSLRVSQLAKNDIAVSDSLATGTEVTGMAGVHRLQFNSGDYTSFVDVTLTGTETNATVMQKISDTVNYSKAVVTSSSKSAGGAFTGAGSFTVNVEGTETAIAYDYSDGTKTYSEIIADIATKINSKVSGVTAEKVVNEDLTVSLKLTVDNSSSYISLNSTSGDLLGSSNLNMSATKLRAASNLVSTAVFSAAPGKTKISFTAQNTGYDYRLQMSDVSGSALNFLGLKNDILSSHTKNVDDSSAGFIYNITSSTTNDLNSKFLFNGINVQSNSNTLSTLATGVTFNLKSVMTDTETPVTVNVASDVTTVKTKIKDFITKYNSVYSYIKQNSTSGQDGRGIFVSDITANSLMKSLTNIAISQVSGIPSGKLSYLSQAGITFDPTVGLSVTDDTKLTSVLTSKPTEVAALFNSTAGIATRLYTESNRYVGSSGTISKLQYSLNNNISYLNKKVDSTQKSIDKSASTLKDQYNRMQSQLVALLNAQQSFSSFGG